MCQALISFLGMQAGVGKTEGTAGSQHQRPGRFHGGSWDSRRLGKSSYQGLSAEDRQDRRTSELKLHSKKGLLCASHHIRCFTYIGSLTLKITQR